MKHNIRIIVGMVVALLLLLGCTTSQTTQKTPVSSTSETGIAGGTIHQATLVIEGMFCPSCAMGVEYQLKQVEGVHSAEVSYPEGKGIVTYDASKVTAEEIAAASTAYPATVIEDNIHLK